MPVAWAQVPVRFAVPVIANGDTLRSAWAGGLNQPQFSQIDWDGDSRPDLFVHDREDGSRLVFRATGLAAPSNWAWLPAPGNLPPPSPAGWMLLRDYNGDGRPDAFTNELSGVRIYRNDGPAAGGGWRWTPGINPLRFLPLNAAPQPVYVNSADVPGIADIDGDGDLDLLSWDLTSQRVGYYRNDALQNLGRADTFALRVPSQCWGNFREAFDPLAPLAGYTVTLNVPDCDLAVPKTDHEGGGTLLPLDLNGDARTDLLIGDAGIPYMIGLVNGGTAAVANMTAFIQPFPAANPIQLPSYPAAFYVDADADGRRDLLVAPNEAPNSPDTAGVLRYRNTGTDAAPAFSLQQDDFLQGQMIDLGTAALPAWADVDGDGLIDLVVGVQRQNRPPGGRTSRLKWYRNTGTPSRPVLRLADADWLGLNANGGNLIWYAPGFGDVDGDGDADLLLGVFDPDAARGRLRLYRSQSANGLPGDYVLAADDFLGFGSLVVAGLSPHLADLDGDGDLDLLVGSSAGQIFAYENTGSVTQPQFDRVSEAWGGISFPTNVLAQPRARVQIVDLGQDGSLDALVGSEAGTLRVFTGVGLRGTFTESGIWNSEQFGMASAPAAARLYGSSDTLALVVGGLRGGLQLRVLPNATLADRPDLNAPGQLFVRVQPNPARTTANINAPAGTLIDVYDLLGRNLFQGRVGEAGAAISLDVSSWATGVYLVRGVRGGLVRSTRLLVH